MIAKIENQHNLRRMLLLAVAVGFAVVAGLLAWRFAPAPWFQDATDEVSIGLASYAIDPTDDRKLVGFASDVFFGRVTENMGQIMAHRFPRSRFKVEVLEVLKGTLSGTVIVTQDGGVFEDGASFRMKGDLELLETGATYLLAVKGPSPERLGAGYLLITGGYGKYEVLEGTGEPSSPPRDTGSDETSEGGGSPGEALGKSMSEDNTDAPGILNTQKANALRSRFADAIENEIPFDFGDTGDEFEEHSLPGAQPAE